MTQSLISLGLFVAILACVPMALKWLRKQSGIGGEVVGAQSKVISAVAVGPQQRVVSVEVGPDGNRVRLTLGVTAQSISLLHTAPVIDTPVSESARLVSPGVNHG